MQPTIRLDNATQRGQIRSHHNLVVCCCDTSASSQSTFLARVPPVCKFHPDLPQFRTHHQQLQVGRHLYSPHHESGHMLPSNECHYVYMSSEWNYNPFGSYISLLSSGQVALVAELLQWLLPSPCNRHFCNLIVSIKDIINIEKAWYHTGSVRFSLLDTGWCCAWYAPLCTIVQVILEVVY